MMLNLSYSAFNQLWNRGFQSLKLLVLINDADSIQTPEDRAKVLARLEGVNGFEKLIIIFTANDISGFDEALLRPGRMDYHLKFEKVMT
jgi:SpoVK/Ycf46/Vps4 family AAA+-type ATPase